MHSGRDMSIPIHSWCMSIHVASHNHRNTNATVLRLQAAQQELAEAQATVSQLHADLEDMQQKSAQAVESAQAAMQAQADRAQQQLAQVSASLEEAQNESEQVRQSPLIRFTVG